MDYFITLNEKSIEQLGEAVEKPITVIDELKETLAETIQEKDAIIAEKEQEIEELEEALEGAKEVEATVSYNISGDAGAGNFACYSYGGYRESQNDMITGVCTLVGTSPHGATNVGVIKALHGSKVVIQLSCLNAVHFTITRSGFADNTQLSGNIPSDGVVLYRDLGALDYNAQTHSVLVTIG